MVEIIPALDGRNLGGTTEDTTICMVMTRLEKVALGYLAAVLCASCYAIFCGYTSDHQSLFEIARASSNKAVMTSATSMLIEVVNFVLYAAAVVLAVILFTSIGSASAIAVGELIGIKGWWYYAFAGALNGVAIAGGLFGPVAYHGLSFGQQLFIGGFLSGLVYWFIAVKNSAGLWDARGGGPLVAFRQGLRTAFASVRGRGDQKSTDD